MKFESIKIQNFRQYYGNTDIDLSTNEPKNIVLIGGKNGYGKTNLLLAIVWCLYGEKISQVDENFKKEIQKEKNYLQFMRQSLNWDSKKEDVDSFSVEICINGLELPLNHNSTELSEIRIRREFNVSQIEEKLFILNNLSQEEIFTDETDKINFINDYIIPLDAGKFVFFDAEKIAGLAELSTKEEGNILNDALGKILGLDIYEDLIEDLDFYCQTLTREAASGNLQEQIIDREDLIKREENTIVQLEERNAELAVELEKIKFEIRSFENFINDHTKDGSNPIDREILIIKRDKIESRFSELDEKFNQLSELIPLAILSGHLESLNEHIKLQDSNNALASSADENKSRVEAFIERLFNQPPEPKDSTLSLKDKMFYYQKALSLSETFFDLYSEENDLDFEHDLSNSGKEQIFSALNLIGIQSKEVFETTMDSYDALLFELNELNKAINIIDSDLEDETVLEYITKKEISERKQADYNQQIGVNKEKISKLNKNIARSNQEYQNLLEKVEISQKNKNKLIKTRQYINVLQLFVDKQKDLKKDSLAKNILRELQKLMHKLDKDSDQFVTDVKVTILANGGGMKITLYNKEDVEIKKETLSQGEKQLYISCLIKAILKESIQSLPIFIDTPLGRLDNEHIKNILLYYYPDLSDQVIILSTNNEITPSRYTDILGSISKTYLLENYNNRTRIKQGYFKNAQQ